MKRIALYLLIGMAAAAAETPQELFQKALVKERSEGNLNEAIQLYRHAADSAGKDRALAAKALVQLGECYEKLGSTEARKQYDRVIRDYADQKDAVAMARARLGGSAALQNAGIGTRQVWTGPGVDGETGSPSPDGRYLTFTNWETGDLGLRDLTTGTNRLLTNSGGWEASGDYADGSVISPDGRQVAYSWFLEKELRNELRIVPITGGTPRIVYRSDSGNDYMAPYGWTPDGKQLLVAHTLADRTSQIAMVSVQDGSVRVLKSFGWQFLRASISPDGRHIAYDLPVDDKTQFKDIFVLATDGSRETAVVQSPSNDFAPLWSPDGSRVLFLSDRTGNYSLWSVPIEDGKPKGPAELVKADTGPIRPLGITRSGTFYYGLSGSSRRNIYTAELRADMKVSKEPWLATERFVNSNSGPEWSPDGQYLAYYSFRPGSTVVVIRTLKTGEERDIPMQLPVVSHFYAGPKWFPDGRSVLVLTREVQRPGLGFYRVDVTSGSTEMLHHTKQPFQGFALSPEGKTIFYSEVNSENSAPTMTTRLMRFDLDSRQETELRKGEWFISLAVSPDSKQLAYLVSVRPGASSFVAVMPAAGGEAREVFRGAPWVDGSRYNALAWTPDQRYLLFVRASVDSGPNVLWRVPVTGGEPEQMGVSMMSRIKNPRVHPDGRRIVFGAAEADTNEVWALENFLPKLNAQR